MKQKKVTYRQLLGYIEQVETRVKTNQQAVYDLSQVFSEYVEMRNKGDQLNSFMRQKHGKGDLGSGTWIQTRWSVFSKFFKDKYLQLKKILAFE